MSATSASEGTTREARGTRAAVVCVQSHGFHDRGPPLASEETQLATGPHAAGPHFWLEAHDPGDRASTPRASPAPWRGTGHAPRSKGDTFTSRCEATPDGSRAPAAAWERGLGLRGSPPTRIARTAGNSPPPRPGPGTRGLRVTCALVEEAPETPGHVGPARGQVRSWWRGGRLGLGGTRESPRGRPPPETAAWRGKGARGDPAEVGAAQRSFPCGDAPRGPRCHPAGGRSSRSSRARGARSRAGMAARDRRGARGAELCPGSGEASVLHPCGLPPRPTFRGRPTRVAWRFAQKRGLSLLLGRARPGSASPASARTLALGGSAHSLPTRSARSGDSLAPCLCSQRGAFLCAAAYGQFVGKCAT